MRKLLVGIMLVASCMFTTVGNCGEWRDLNTRVEKSGLDTPIHIGLGIAGSALTYHYLPGTMNPVLRRGIAFVVPVVVGTIKEATDINFNAGDIGGYAIGSAISVTVISLTF